MVDIWLASMDCLLFPVPTMSSAVKMYPLSNQVKTTVEAGQLGPRWSKLHATQVDEATACEDCHISLGAGVLKDDVDACSSHSFSATDGVK